MKVTSFALGPFAANCLVLEAEGCQDVFLVDPGFDVEQVILWLKRRNKKPCAVLLTHAHLDHAWGCGAVKESFPEVPVWLHEKDLPLLENLATQAHMFGFPTPPAVTGEPVLKDGLELSLAGERFLVRHCPGHSPGHVVFLGEDNGQPWAVVGDVIFAGSVGRTDLWGGSWDELEASIRPVIYRLPGDTVLYPGHGPTTTVGEERLSNPFVSDT